ncbi:MAG: hypothetical protein JSV65_01425 [Armatimonadota bacterium]|nr:MAG: hypothetical protein JSV65_01425 [Armatimonadota bacterium]
MERRDFAAAKDLDVGAIYLGADIGTTSAKCLAVDEDGRVLGSAQHPYALSHPHENWAEQDAEDYWRGLVDVVTACVRACEEQGRTSREINALALSTQGDTLIMVDETGTPLAPAISWMDTRAERQCRELIAETGPRFWYRETGARLTPYSSACKIRWLAQAAPELRARVHRFCGVPDFLAHRLCGNFVTDVPSASWTPLFSPSERQWSEQVVRRLEVDSLTLPQVVESGTTIGALLPETASTLGLSADAVLVAGAFDQAAAAYGTGATAGRTSVLSCGTAWVLYAVSSVPVVDERERIAICCHTSASEWGLVLPFTGGAAYDWFHAAFCTGVDEDTRAEPLVFIPHLYGGLSPDWRAESRGSLLGLTMAHSYGDVEAAVMRGLACEARRNVETAEALCAGIPSLRMVGGAGRSDVWPQMIADVLGRPVGVSELTEAACYGAAKLAAGAAAQGWDETESAREFVPDSRQAEAESRFYERYLRAYEAVLEFYAGGSSADGARD